MIQCRWRSSTLHLLSYLGLIPSLALCVILGANNLSTCLGMSIGSRRLTYSQALALASVGVMAGILLEGNKLSGAITSGIISSKNPTIAINVVLSSVFVMVFLTYRRLPISLSQVAVGAAVGAAIAEGIDVNWAFTSLIAVSWLVTPFAGFIVADLISALTMKLGRRVRGVFTQNIMYSYLTILSGVYASYALGANTVGLIIGMVDTPASQHLLVSIAMGLATVFGMVLFSRGTTQSVAEDIVGLSPSASFASQMGGAATVHGFTQFGIPVSVSQAVVGGIFGAAIPRKFVVRNSRLTREIALGWSVAPLFGAGLALVVNAIL
jgi:PiT family inorganic phosphate transporter